MVLSAELYQLLNLYVEVQIPNTSEFDCIWRKDFQRSNQEIVKQQELEHLKNSQPTHISKNDKVCSGENTKGISVQSITQQIADVTHGSVQPLQQNPGKELKSWGYTSINTFQLGQKETKRDKMQQEYQTSGILQDGTIELSGCELALSFKK